MALAPLFRSAQEAVTNAVRHGQTESTGIDLTFGEGHVRLSVRDDGRGFDVEAAAGGAVDRTQAVIIALKRGLIHL